MTVAPVPHLDVLFWLYSAVNAAQTTPAALIVPAAYPSIDEEWHTKDLPGYSRAGPNAAENLQHHGGTDKSGFTAGAKAVFATETGAASLRPPLVLVKVPERFGGPQCRNGDISLTSNPGAPPPGALIGKLGTERHMPVPATSLVLLRQKEELILVVCPSKASTCFDNVRDVLVS